MLFRAWLHNAWTIDRNQPGCPDGHADFELAAPALPPPLVDRQPPNPARLSRVAAARVRQRRAVGSGHQAEPCLHPEPCLCAGAHPSGPGRREPERRAERSGARSRKNGDRSRCCNALIRSSLYVPAPAGAGKSTFCRWAALQSIPGAAMSHPVPAPEEFEEPVPTALHGRLPLLVPLREFWMDMDCGRGRRTWAAPSWSRRSPPGSTVRRPGPDRRPAQGPPGGRQRLPVAGRPGRGAGLGDPRRHGLSPGAAAERPGRRPARSGRRPATAPCSPAAPTAWMRPGSPASASSARRSNRCRSPSRPVRHPLVPHPGPGRS